jgi:CRP-like cAMP-binding protein
MIRSGQQEWNRLRAVLYNLTPRQLLSRRRNAANWGDFTVLTDTELIRKLDFFEPLDQKIIKSIASLCIVREFPAGEAIVRQGEAGLGLYFITGGKAKVEIDRAGGKVIVAELRPGDFLGEFSLIDEKTRSASVICLEDTRCLLLTRDTFSKLLTKHPEIANQMLRTLVGRIRNTNERVSSANPTPRPPPAEAPPTTEAAAPQSTGGGGLSAATEQIMAYVPKPEEIMQFYSSTKNQTQRFLNRFFGAIYAMKAMLRFSMAMVGCPVTVSAERASQDMIEANCNGVKLFLFPASEDQTLRIEGVGEGVVSATVYRPVQNSRGAQVEIFRLQGPIRKDDVLRLHLRAGCPAQVEPSLRNQPPMALITGGSPPSLCAPPQHWLVTEARWH